MPPKRKRKDAEESPEKEKTKETKEEKKQRIELQKAKAKQWAENRKAAAKAKVRNSEVGAENGEDGITSAPTPVKRKAKKTVSKTPKSTTKKKSTTGTRASMSSAKSPIKKSTQKTNVAKEVVEEKEEYPEPKPKRRRILKQTEESPKPAPAPAPAPAVKSPEPVATSAYNLPTPVHFLSPNGAVIGQNPVGSNIVYVPVNLAAVPVPVPAPAPTPVPIAPQMPIAPQTNGATVPIAPPTSAAIAPITFTVNKKEDTEKETQSKPEIPAQTSRSISFLPVTVVEEESEEETEHVPKPSTRNTFRKLMKYALSMVTACAVFFIGFSMLDGTELKFPNLASDGETSSTPVNGTPCFANFGIGGQNEETDLTCENPTDCPQHGRCEGGKLVDCLLEDIQWEGGFYAPSSKNDQCVVSPDAMERMLELHSTLVDLTVEYVCRGDFGFVGSVCRVSMDDIVENGSILFARSKVANITNMSEQDMQTLLKMMETDDIVLDIGVEDGVEKEYIGMSENYISNQLPIPTACWLRVLFWDLIRFAATFAYGCVKLFATVFWSFATANPLPTLVIFIVTYTILWVRSKRAKIAGLRKEASDIQNIAYDKLVMDCNEGEGYASLHLRDEIAHELYPEPCAARQRLNNLVWPRVVALIRADNRVTKSRKTVGGKSLEWFEWASDSSRKSRRSLAANGNNGDNTMKTTKVE